MKRLISSAALVCVVVAALAAQKELRASKAWIKTPAAGESSAVAFALIENPTMYDVYVVSASTEAAGAVQFRRLPAAGGAAEDVESLTAPAYGAVELKAGGIHMLLTGLKRPLESGQTVVITLTTDSGLEIEAVAEVRDK